MKYQEFKELQPGDKLFVARGSVHPDIIEATFVDFVSWDDSRLDYEFGFDKSVSSCRFNSAIRRAQ